MNYIYKNNNLQGGEPISHDCLDDIKDISEALNNFTTYSAMKERGYSQDSGMSRGYSRGRYSRNGYSRGGYDDWGREPRNMY